jgi:type IV pilus assembly protein PilB
MVVMVIFNEEKQNKKLDELRKGEEENLARTLSSRYGTEYMDLSIIAINSDALRVLTEAEAREAKMAVFDITDKRIKVAVLAPENDKTLAEITKLKSRGFVPQLFMVSPDSLEKVWARYKDLSYSFETKGGALDISNEQITTFLSSVHSVEDVRKLIDEMVSQKKSYKISRLLEILVAGALALKASDIHVEPEEAVVKVRYRLDGVLTEILEFENDIFRLLSSRIKLLSGMKLNVGSAQDGRFSIIVGDSEIEIRSSILPSAYDESIVLRVLNPDSISVPLEELGIPQKLLKILELQISKPEGMILTTGPTGSGKTTTLYAFLKKIHTPDIKIITIENPVEYHLPGIVQTQTNLEKGYTFIEGLRSALRQDPDIIMVGEIRDEETAEIAVNSALTGHLVFSTLHTNSAAGTFPRLIDLGVNPKIITSAVSIAMAQRLVRKLCPVCKKKIKLEGRNQEIVTRILAGIKSPEDKLAETPDSIYEPVGCKECNNTGYQGRIGIYEAVLRSEAIEKVIIQNPSDREIAKAAEDQGILSLRQDGILKVLRGITSLPELERVVDLEGYREM